MSRFCGVCVRVRMGVLRPFTLLRGTRNMAATGLTTRCILLRRHLQYIKRCTLVSGDFYQFMLRKYSVLHPQPLPSIPPHILFPALSPLFLASFASLYLQSLSFERSRLSGSILCFNTAVSGALKICYTPSCYPLTFPLPSSKVSPSLYHPHSPHLFPSPPSSLLRSTLSLFQCPRVF